MDELAGHLATWGAGTLFLTALVFGFFPVFAVNLLARVYPKEHPRRAELVAELHDVPRRERLIWVAEQLATVLFDGVPERVRARRRDASAERERREFQDLTAVEQMERLRILIARLRSFGSDDSCRRRSSASPPGERGSPATPRGFPGRSSRSTCGPIAGRASNRRRTGRRSALSPRDRGTGPPTVPGCCTALRARPVS